MSRLIEIMLCSLIVCLISCSNEKYSKNTEFFKGTEAYRLAKAVEDDNLEIIEELAKHDSTLLEVPNPTTGSNVLVLAIEIERFVSFKRLLELGANPNFINPLTKHSVLIDAIKPFGNQTEWRKESQYVKLLLDYGADPNYAIENEFTNKKQRHISATSPLVKASSLDLGIVKMLLNKGADPYKKLGEAQITPFSKAVSGLKIDIITYYIDSLKINVHQPMGVRNNDSLFIQDYIVNKFSIAKLKGDSVELDKLKKENKGIEDANQERWELIIKLESLGVDFKNYDYKF
jgi:hypothetical protein